MGVQECQKSASSRRHFADLGVQIAQAAERCKELCCRDLILLRGALQSEHANLSLDTTHDESRNDKVSLAIHDKVSLALLLAISIWFLALRCGPSSSATDQPSGQ